MPLEKYLLSGFVFKENTAMFWRMNSILGIHFWKGLAQTQKWNILCDLSDWWHILELVKTTSQKAHIQNNSENHGQSTELNQSSEMLLGQEERRLMKLFPDASNASRSSFSIGTCRISSPAELVQAMWNEDERNAGMEQGSGDIDRKTVCIFFFFFNQFLLC